VKTVCAVEAVGSEDGGSVEISYSQDVYDDVEGGHSRWSPTYCPFRSKYHHL